MKHITIACENTDAIQAMYVDGILVRDEDNFYLSDIAEVAEGKIVTLRSKKKSHDRHGWKR